MNNNDILNKLSHTGNSCMPSDRLDPTSIENSLSNVRRKSNKGVATLCISLGIVCLSVIGVGLSTFTHPTLPIKTKTSQVENYDDIYNVVKSVKKANKDTILEKIEDNVFGNYKYDTLVNSESIATNDFAMADDVSANLTTGATPEHSETNIQVNGVDEADVVKTDGEYIYSVYDNEIIITKPNNGNPEKVSSINYDSEISDIYIYDDTLVALSLIDLNFYGNIANMEEEFYDNVSSNIITQVYIYSLADINNPTEISTLTQSGAYLSSRRIDDVVYLTTRYHIYDYETVYKEQPETYCPFYNTENGIECIPPEDIMISENVSTIQYVTVSSINLNSPQEFTDVCSVLGSGSEIYASLNNLYVASHIYADESNNTEFMRFSLDNGDINHNNTFTVAGNLLNQFSMDEHNGFFRVVTEVTEYNNVYSENFLTNSIAISNDTKTALFVFDNELNLVGKTEDVANGEHVKSVRFDGDIAYFVTFRQTDPLFTVDLSDPYAPTILSELKIPGFSEYLHIFGDGLLFGFGREADINTGRAEGLKLTMFDTSDKTNVTELATRIFTDNDAYSIAESDHKAIFVDIEKNIVGIPYQTYTDNGTQGYYAIFRYDNELKDFALCQRICVDDYYEYSYLNTGDYIRGLYIGDYFYVVTPKEIYSFDYKTFEPINTVEITN